MKKNTKWIVLAVTCLVLFVPSYCQYQLPPLAPELMTTFNLTMTEFSSVFSATMIPAIFLSLIAGMLVDKFGIKKIIGISILVTIVGVCSRIYADSFTSLMITMMLIGFSAAFLNANGPKIIGSYFPQEKISSMMSFLLASSTLAMTIGMGTTGFFSSIQSAFIVAAVISIIAGVLWLLFMKDPIKNENERLNKQVSITIGESLITVVKCQTVWVVGFCLMANMGCFVAISSFLPTALVGRGIDTIAAGMYGSIMTMGTLFGCLTAPLVVKKVGKMKPVMMIMAIVAAIGSAFFWNAPEGVLLGVGMFIFGATSSGLMPLLMSIPIQMKEIGPAFAGTAGGLTATLQLIGAVIIPTFIIIPIAGTNMTMFFMLTGVSMAISAGMILFLPELLKK